MIRNLFGNLLVRTQIGMRLQKIVWPFSNAYGGTIDYDIENDSDEPPIEQVIDENLPITLMNKINSKTTNVTEFAEIFTHKNGAQYISLHILRGHTVTSTSSGKYYLRIAGNSVLLICNDIVRLAAEKRYFPWEDQATNIIEDLKIYSCAPMKDIHQRIGKDIPYKRILSQMKSLVHDNIIKDSGHNRWVKYLLIEE